MIIILKRRKWKRTFEETEKYCVTIHVFGNWYLVRNLLKGDKIRRPKHIIWAITFFLVNKKDFSEI